MRPEVESQSQHENVLPHPISLSILPICIDLVFVHLDIWNGEFCVSNLYDHRLQQPWFLFPWEVESRGKPSILTFNSGPICIWCEGCVMSTISFRFVSWKKIEFGWSFITKSRKWSELDGRYFRGFIILNWSFIKEDSNSFDFLPLIDPIQITDIESKLFVFW